MRIRRSHRIALAVAVLTPLVGLVPVASASAEGSDVPSVTVSHSQAIDMYGPAGDIDLTVAAPPSTDAFLRLDLYAGASNIRVTDDAGNVLPVVDRSPSPDTVEIGAADSDGNGVKGAPMTAGTTHLHISAAYPVYGQIMVQAQLVDGATGKDIADSSTNHSTSDLIVYQPYFTPSWDLVDGVRYSGGPQVVTGGPHAIPERLDTQMRWSAPAPTKATSTRMLFSAAQIAAAGYTAEQLVKAVTLRFSADGQSYAVMPWTRGADGSLSIDFPAIDWSASAHQSQYVSFKAVWGLPAGDLAGRIEVRDPQGRQYVGAPETLHFTADVRPAGMVPVLYGRDAKGDLWLIPGIRSTHDSASYSSRHLVGGGWGGYTALTSLAPQTWDAAGDVVARDKSGVLWLYSGTLNPSGGYFGSRTRVGTGWNIYTTLAGTGDVTGDGNADLLARDATGELWLYRGTGDSARPFQPRTAVGPGWNTYNALTHAGDVTGDGRADLIARDTTGELWLYAGTGNPAAPYARRVPVGPGWNAYTHLLGVGDLHGDGHDDLIATDPTGLWYYEGTGNPAAPFKPRLKISDGWQAYNTLL
ncbi:FG-GAP repeat domain-containing protein [Streptomyces sp. CBMA29]|uniref:FG-GAP repeat domain-containing protein n=1 Tax=Streptomyces sp. CBMA29 TaxID=1896314 RepID=UPI001CB750B5|nr:VCBS repeat-containing protein [Streptomyces sp. CBMA29]MBD0740313.1 hypothetical protein [Streptomyces sp. CBMA29]